MWSVETLNATVDAEIEALPPDLRARVSRTAALIEAKGLESLSFDMVKHLEGKLWELRVKAQSGIARAIYVTAVGRRVVLLVVFLKKSQKTPGRVLQLARERARMVR